MEITCQMIEAYRRELQEREKSKATQEKYIRDVSYFYQWLNHRELSKEAVIEYKQSLVGKYQVSSLNSMLISINGFLGFCGLGEYKVKLLKMQKKQFIDTEREMTKEEYRKLLQIAKEKGNERLFMLIQTICSTGIRVSEHQYITVEALAARKAVVSNKGKARYIFFPEKLLKELNTYCKRRKITSGPIFVTKNGNPVNRSNIWGEMKALCEEAGLEKAKVFPHNLRHLFAFTYYDMEKDLTHLADILGHSSIETTRIYTMASKNDFEKKLSKMGLAGLFC